MSQCLRRLANVFGLAPVERDRICGRKQRLRLLRDPFEQRLHALAGYRGYRHGVGRGVPAPLAGSAVDAAYAAGAGVVADPAYATGGAKAALAAGAALGLCEGGRGEEDGRAPDAASGQCDNRTFRYALRLDPGESLAR